MSLEEAVAAGVERADRLCRGNQFAHAVRRMLLSLERLAHAGGWDGPDAKPRLFQLDRALDGPTVCYAWTDTFNQVLYKLIEANGGRVGVGVRLLGEHVERHAHWLRHGDAGPGDDVDPERVAAVLAEHESLRAAGAAGNDLGGPASGDPSFRFFGYGLRSEAWGPVATPESLDAAHSHQLGSHPGREMGRFVSFVGRDGLAWWIVRRRGAEPLAAVYDHECDLPTGGTIVHGLSRMVRGTANNPVPLFPAAPSKPPPGPSKPNPLFRQS